MLFDKEKGRNLFKRRKKKINKHKKRNKPLTKRPNNFRKLKLKQTQPQNPKNNYETPQEGTINLSSLYSKDS